MRQSRPTVSRENAPARFPGPPLAFPKQKRSLLYSWLYPVRGIGPMQEPINAIIMGTIMTVVTLNMIRIDRRRRESLQLQLYGQIRRAIISGELGAGVRLPSTRDLVEQLDLSRNTIVYAFERLVAEGYLEGRVGSGMYVANLPAINQPPGAKDVISGAASDGRSRISRQVASLSKVRVTPEYLTSKVRPFRACQPAIDHFPLRTWNRARSSALRLHAKELMREGDVIGLPRLRRALAAYLRDARGARC